MRAFNYFVREGIIPAMEVQFNNMQQLPRDNPVHRCDFASRRQELEDMKAKLQHFELDEAMVCEYSNFRSNASLGCV